jgi:CBS domain-containing protein
MLKEVELKHYMVQNPVKVRADANLFDAIHLILVNKISGLCVVDERNKLIGVLSRRTPAVPSAPTTTRALAR